MSEHTEAALTEHDPQPVRAGALRGVPYGLTSPATACFHRGTSVRQKWRNSVGLSKFILNWLWFVPRSQNDAMIVHALGKISFRAVFGCGWKMQKGREIPTLCANGGRISGRRWRAVGPQPGRISSLRADGVDLAPKAVPLAVRLRRRLRISSSGASWSWLSPAIGFVKHNLTPQCGRDLAGKAKF